MTRLGAGRLACVIAKLRASTDGRPRPSRQRSGIAGAGFLVTVALALSLALPSPGLAASKRSAAVRSHPRASQLSVDWALSGTASATSVQNSDPASNATDGDAGSDWCPNSWTGTLTIDLGQVRRLDALGITLDGGSPSADASMSIATQSGQWHAVPTAGDVALDPGRPMYFTLPRGTNARYAELTVYSGTGAPVCVGEFRAFGPDPDAARMALGADLSFTPQELAAGARFTDRGRVATPVKIIRNHGANYVRMRLWVNPPPGYSNLDDDLALARSVRSAGMKIYLDIQYSDFWADPSKQNVPAAWRGQDPAQLTATVHSYTEQVIAAFARQGTPVDLVSIGNEIRNGILWPFGEINSTTTAGGWANLATLLKAGVAGARAGDPRGHKLLIMMHYDQGGNNQLSQAFFQNLVSREVPFDVIGLSYYPFFHGPISAMRQNVDALAMQFHKPIMIAETQYAWTLANGNSAIGDSTGDFVWEPSLLSPGYSATPGGQLSFVNDELSILAQVPDRLGAGLFYWAPDWIPGVGWEPGTGVGSPNVNLTLFNFQGAALPSIGIFQSPAAVCVSRDPDQAPCVIGG